MAVDERVRLYPDPEAVGLREDAARLYDVPVESILAGNGSDDVLTILTRVFVPLIGAISKIRLRIRNQWSVISNHDEKCVFANLLIPGTAMALKLSRRP